MTQLLILRTKIAVIYMEDMKMSSNIRNIKRRMFEIGNRGEVDIWNMISSVVSIIIVVIVVLMIKRRDAVNVCELQGDAQIVEVETEQIQEEVEIPQVTQIATTQEKTVNTATTNTETSISPPTVVNVPDVWLSELDYIKKGSVEIENDRTGKTNTGEEFQHYIYPHRPYSDVTYYLGGKYDKLTAIWTICYNDKNTEDENSFDIYSDDVLVYSSKTLTGGSLPEDVSVDIKGCQVLTIMFKAGSGAGVLGNIRLYGTTDPNTSAAQPEVLPCWLTDLDYLMECDVYIKDNDKCVNNIGDTYNHALKGSAGAEITYYLNGQYSSISGMWAIKEQYKNTDHNCQFAIYADDALVYTSPSITAGSLPVDFAVDINRCQMLKIAFLDGHGEADVGNIRLFP